MTKEELQTKIKDLKDRIAMAEMMLEKGMPVSHAQGLVTFGVKDWLGLVAVEKMEVE